MLILLTILTVKINHGVSTRTGHGKWWTAGLMFAGWLFWPVTAVHYQKGDEVTPRPFTGWRKGLLIIFGAILPIISIIGILAAAIFPTMTGYLSRARDAARISYVGMASTALATYYVDMETYPAIPQSGCLPVGDIQKYLGSAKVQDPTPSNIMP